MDLQKFIIDQAFILVPVLYIIGKILKNTPKIKDWTIPYLLLIFGIAGAIGIMGFTVEALFQGVIVTGMTVFSNQLIKQTCNKDKDMCKDNNDDAKK